MIILETKADLLKRVAEIKSAGKTIGFVPTMGALHAGHIELVKRASAENDVCVVSVFVNPTQFNDKGDLERYPRTLEKDAALLETAGCELVFAPSAEELYSAEEMASTYEFDFAGLDKVMEGQFRPNHFNGVVQVVSRLFDLVTPTRAYFGEKDYQQLAIIRHLVESMKYDLEIVGCPIVREESGLARSSRNELLSAEEREVASMISKVLAESKQFALQTSVDEFKEAVVAAINRNEPLKVEYFDIADAKTLRSVDSWSDASDVVGCVAVFCGKVRLIDNIIYK